MQFSICSQSSKPKPHLVDNFCWFLCEFIGTAMLLFLGCMGCIESDMFPSNNITRSLNFGLVVLIIIQCFGCCSGAHLNPAVTIAAYMYKLISLPMAGAYCVAQILGAYCGYGLLKLFLPAQLLNVPGNEVGLCMTTVHSELEPWQGLGIETFITATLITVCCAVWDPRNTRFQDSVGIKFGLAVASLSMTAGPLTGASMNPARTLGPALWQMDFRNHWIYWLGPIAGSVLATGFYKYVFRREVANEPEKSPIKTENA